MSLISFEFYTITNKVMTKSYANQNGGRIYDGRVYIKVYKIRPTICYIDWPNTNISSGASSFVMSLKPSLMWKASMLMWER